MTLATAVVDGQHLAWDPARVADADARLFDPAWWRSRGAVRGEAAGRGAAYFVDGLDGAPWVLRHNRRGGAFARLNHDRFLWTGAARLRPIAELRLLAAMRADDLPVPAPVAARAVRGGGFYRGDVITAALVESRPLADRLATAPLPATEWQRLGGVLARFHRAGIDHADLNARNILIDAADAFHLIDFDKARRRAPGRWRESNLARLKRSLDKCADGLAEFHFAEGDWSALRGGYASVFAAR
ncbi:3-deoxy-D-manno-octulosonic acid kinase [Salinisphaera orenii]|uniref:3-deoxy-D-manno-octulosonic acid kinase n=1 Tax=Salinisphaera orenii YIM 95161 TaxID=1051139 RepID=A0A423PYH9_9GAMM|nr:3-deoxy-D-manno-octulosonic acid kinase [Salinisphaera halophila]ROO30677.1 3-deoxy-D-manno-octulosonic acid kinase [Salinisphaera halophila YIM 95161]